MESGCLPDDPPLWPCFRKRLLPVLPLADPDLYFRTACQPNDRPWCVDQAINDDAFKEYITPKPPSMAPTKYSVVVNTFLDTRLSSFLLQFVVYGRQIAIGGMETLAAIKHFNIFEHRLFSLRAVLIGLMMYPFGF
jgi:hypothetical protein